MIETGAEQERECLAGMDLSLLRTTVRNGIEQN